MLPRSDLKYLDQVLCIMHNLCMATKTISLKMEAYEKLRNARRSPDESFSDVVLRAVGPRRPSLPLSFCVCAGVGVPCLPRRPWIGIERLKRRDALPRHKRAKR